VFDAKSAEIGYDCSGFEHLIAIKNKPSFSLLNWLHGKAHQDSTVFLPCEINQREELQSYFTLFINAFARQLLALPDDPKRCFALFLDELPALYPLDAIIRLLSVSRSKGAIIILL
jgi:type IV secretory pathway TraG/TraD family ATPase VirD4